MRADRELSRAVELVERHFDEGEWAALQSAADKLGSQTVGSGVLKDATVLTEPERISVAKFMVLGSHGEWRPEFARMTAAEVLAALKPRPKPGDQS